MSKEYWLLKTFKTIGFALILGVSLTACGAGSIKWKEEVLLHDGKIIIVERETIREAGGGEWASNRSGSKPKQYCMQFEYPVASRQVIKWCSVKADEGGWPEVPLVLDIETGAPIIFTTFRMGNTLTCKVYIKYVYRNGNWGEEKLAEQFDPYKTNLIFASKKDLPEVLRTKDKNKRNNETGYHKAFKQVGPNRKVCAG